MKFNRLTIWLFWLNCWLRGCGFESRCSHFNVRYCVCFEQGAPSRIHAITECRFTLKCVHTVSLSPLLNFWVRLPAYISCQLSSQEANYSWPQNLMYSYYMERTDSKPFSGLIGPRHMTTSRAVAHQSWVARCSPHVL